MQLSPRPFLDHAGLCSHNYRSYSFFCLTLSVAPRCVLTFEFTSEKVACITSNIFLPLHLLHIGEDPYAISTGSLAWRPNIRKKGRELTLWTDGQKIYMGQCPAKSGLWGYNFITIKIARCTKQNIFATVLCFPFKFRTLVPTPFLCVKIDFCVLHLFRAVDTTIVNPAG